MTRPRHDAAWATTQAVVALVNLRDEEACEAFLKVYERIETGLEADELQAGRIQARLRPLSE